MGIKLKIKYWLSKKIKSLLSDVGPTLLVSNSNLEVGKESYHNGNFDIRGGGTKAVIGSYCAIGKDVKLILNNHDVNYATMQYSFYKTYFKSSPFNSKKPKIALEIGSDVWIGDNVIILPNVKIGHGAVIGAGSVVTKTVEPYTIVAGTPAKPIKKRFKDDTIKELLQSQWWTWDASKIKENKEFFFKNLNNKNGN